MLPVAILAGGLATRLRPITERIPKSLVEIQGHPFLYHQLRLLESRGVRDVVVCAGYLGEMIRQELPEGEAFGVRIRYSFDGEQLLGTAGAIRRALPLLPDEFFVLYGDSYLPCDYQAVEDSFRRSGKPALMTVYRNEGRHDTSNIEYTGGAIVRYDKRDRTQFMRHIDYGLGVFQKHVFAALPEGEPRDLVEVYQRLIETDQLAALEVAERFYEVGSPEGLHETAEYLRGSAGDVYKPGFQQS